MPLGATGTIIGIEPLIDVNPVRQENINAVEYFYVILFDEPIEYGSSIFGIAEKKVFKVRQSVLINISYGTGANREKQDLFRFNSTAMRSANRNGPRNQGPQFQIQRKDDDRNQQKQSYSQVVAAPANQPNRGQSMPNAQPNGYQRVNGKKSAELPQQTQAAPTSQVPETDGSNALRKLLGISAGSHENKAESTAAPKTIPFDLSAIFNKSSAITDGTIELPTSLPKPPANWHTKPTKEPKDNIGVSSEPGPKIDMFNQQLLMVKNKQLSAGS